MYIKNIIVNVDLNLRYNKRCMQDTFARAPSASCIQQKTIPSRKALLDFDLPVYLLIRFCFVNELQRGSVKVS